MLSPSDGEALLTPPTRAEADVLARGVVSALGGAKVLTSTQLLLTAALFHAMTGFTVEPAAVTAITAEEFAGALDRRNLIFRQRIVQIMLLVALSSRPLREDSVEGIAEYAAALATDEDMIDVARRFADGALDLASIDFARNGYLASVSPDRLAALHAARLDQSWGQVTDDPGLADRWVALEELPAGTLGRQVADFYRDRGFVYPGRPDSAPPLLAQHDWAHVLADYGTSLENEIEVFAFMARANDDPRGFSLLAMVLSLFETGYLAAGAGLFEADPGHLSRAGMATRLADAMRRGALTTGSHDLLDLDWFAIADRPAAVVRREMGLTEKSSDALRAGSAGPWQLGGITEYQLNSARQAAARAGIDYRPWVPAAQEEWTMAVYIVLLRGVNVGGVKLPMADLRRIAGACGLSGARTYIQSGNLVVASDRQSMDEIASELNAAVRADLGLDIPMIVRSQSELQRVIETNPFLKQGAEAGEQHVAFFAQKVPANVFEAAELAKFEPEAARVHEREIYFNLPQGVGHSPMLAVIGQRKSLKLSTMRNWRTVSALASLAEEMEGLQRSRKS